MYESPRKKKRWVNPKFLRWKAKREAARLEREQKLAQAKAEKQQRSAGLSHHTMHALHVRCEDV